MLDQISPENGFFLAVISNDGWQRLTKVFLGFRFFYVVIIQLFDDDLCL